MTRHFVDNPPWVDRVLSDNWTELGQVVDQALLPRTAPVGPRSKKVKVPRQHEFGCGHYGCVLATSRPDIVCKVTTDASEALFVEMAWQRLGRTRDEGWPSGIVQYHKIVELEGLHLKRRIWMLWRDEAWNVGIPWNIQSKVEDAYDKRELRNGLERLDQFKFYASKVRLSIPLVLGDRRVPPEAVKLCQSGDLSDRVIGDILEAEDGPIPPGNHFPKNDYTKTFRGAHRIAAYLQAAQYVVQQMANEPGLYAVGQALEQFLDHGMLLADVHHGNIGQPERGAGPRDWLITDPGHLVVLW